MEAKQVKFYKVKNPTKSFLCALCRAPRQMKHAKNLTAKNYFQLAILSAALSWATFSFMGFKSLLWVFVIWPIAEMTNKLLYRKEIPCPYCGFDATWYRRDVKVARRKVEDFWNKNYPDLVNKKHEMTQALAEGHQASNSQEPEETPQEAENLN